MGTIRSRNADFQQIEALKSSRRKRSQLGLVFVEGVKAINAALGNGRRLARAIVDADRRLSRWAEDVAGRAVDVQPISSELMAELSEKEEPSELLALVERPRLDPAALSREDFVWVVFDRPGSEGNLGSIIRTCDAFGVDALITTGHGVDLFDPVTIRASVGAIFNLEVGHLELPALKQLIADVPNAAICGTSARATVSIKRASLSRPIVICLGNETSGLSRAISELCTELVGIEMWGVASSLNVGAAAAIILYEATRRR